MSYGAPRTVRDYVLYVERRLASAHVGFGHGTDNARDEAAWLVAGAMKIPPGMLANKLMATPTTRERARMRTLLAARIRTRAPLSYLLREAWFAGRRFYVDQRVIVPRSLIGEFLFPGDPSPLAPAGIRSILDLCTGSGAIAISAAFAYPAAQVDAVDISPEALAVAARNVRLHGLGHRVRIVSSDLFAALSGRRYDLILSNPPYVTDDEMRDLPIEYRREPRLALAAGPDGLDLVLPILYQAHKYLTARGRLVLEVGASRGALEARFSETPFLWLASAQDDCVGYWHKEDLAVFRPS
ncbi:MAG TPA: 50S ribosomal protein L3 N(5)-glutamine methyltransferase [Acidiferrobacter sp.]|nr:50S ribosomal protein L3 N(5)-glutamine methyltransferase [Acidiferrobacter sp.]